MPWRLPRKSKSEPLGRAETLCPPFKRQRMTQCGNHWVAETSWSPILAEDYGCDLQRLRAETQHQDPQRHGAAQPARQGVPLSRNCDLLEIPPHFRPGSARAATSPKPLERGASPVASGQPTFLTYAPRMRARVHSMWARSALRARSGWRSRMALKTTVCSSCTVAARARFLASDRLRASFMP